MHLPEDHPLSKDLPPLGHETVLWLRAMRLLRLRLEKGRLPAPLTAFLGRWMPRAEPQAELPASFEIRLEASLLASGADPALEDPRWHALLRLPALRGYWVAELRASHYEHLLRLSRRAWLVDETPLPPGSVIAGLGIPDWSHLPRLAGQGRHFTRHELENGDHVLIETPPCPGSSITARFERQDGRIELSDAREVAV